MFRNLPPANFGATDQQTRSNLKALAAAMSAEIEEPEDGPDPEEGGVPALYTYFGQFVDHDLTFDPVSTLRRSLDPDALVDFRTPTFNLDNLYGRGPDDQPYMYTKDRRFRLGERITGSGGQAGNDLPRFDGRAIIGDPRNDENSLVSQLQGLFLKFHNRVMDDNPGIDFVTAQQLVRFHYQYVVVNDFLSRIVKSEVLDGLKTDGRYDRCRLRFYHWRYQPFMPVEFSVAAYRFGHSMVRPGYRLNDDKLLPILPHPGKKEEALTGFGPMGAGRALDWGRFIDIEQRPGGDENGTDSATRRRLQFAYRIDTSLVGFLHHLPTEIAADEPASLAERDLLRGWLLGLPSGQSVARAMAARPLEDSDIIIGKAVDGEPDPGDVVGPIVEAVTSKGGDGQAFADNCPLWTYILAEAAANKTNVAVPVIGGRTMNTPQLGAVGGRIVAEVFLGLLFGDGSSYLSLDPLWKPAAGPEFGLKDLVDYALGNAVIH